MLNNPSLVEQSATLLTSQLGTQRMETAAIEAGLQTLFQTLQGLQGLEDLGGDSPKLPSTDLMTLRRHPETARQHTSITCLECGSAFKILTVRHLQQHHLAPKQYKRKWGLSLRTPLCTRALSAKRRKVAKTHKLAQNLSAWRAKVAK